jgi:general secretion pathway protein F
MMATYRYKAYDETGAIETGTIEAASREAALDALARRGRLASEIVEAADAGRPTFGTSLRLSRRPFTPAALALFVRELATLTRAALPIDETLRIIALQPLLPPSSRAVARAVEERVVAGSSLSDALASAGPALPEYVSRLVRAGEAAGALPETLEDLAEFIERATTQRERVKSALLYPAVLLAAALVALTVIVMVLVPAITPLFADAGVSPPLPIAVLSGLSATLADTWPLWFAAAIAAVLLTRRLLANEEIAARIDRTLLDMPLAGPIIRRRETARLARTLAILQRGGLVMLDALDIAARVPSNRAYRRAVVEAREAVSQGGNLSSAFSASGLFPEVALRLVGIGEKTGRLGPMLTKLADMEEAVLTRDLDRLTGLVGPVLTVVIGVVVGGLVLSVLGAVVSLNDLALR